MCFQVFGTTGCENFGRKGLESGEGLLQSGFVGSDELQSMDVTEGIGMSGIVFKACADEELFGIPEIGFEILFVKGFKTVAGFQIIGIAEFSPEQAAGVHQIIYKTI